MMQLTEEKHDSWLDKPILGKLVLNWEVALFALIVILAIFSRFYILGARVMSHDENTHVYYSWNFMRGRGFAHDPLMHGPLQFHLIGLTYFMFGDNDFTARTPAALFSIATVAFIWYYRRYLGRAGAMAAAVMMLISPYILYYGRYARNEAFVALFGVISLWALLRYLETGENRYMYLQTIVTVLHFTSKETSFIYAAQALLFLGFYLIFRLAKVSWQDTNLRTLFLAAVIIALLLTVALGATMFVERQVAQAIPEPATPTDQAELVSLESSGPPVATTVLVILVGLTVLAGVYFLIRGYTWKALCVERSFSMLLVMGTLVLPQLSAFPIAWTGKLLNDPTWKIPTNASDVAAMTMTDMVRIGAFVVILTVISIIAGLLWNRRQWLINAALWYGIFTVFYTSMFTNGAGFLTGIVGSLGYWLEQQPVQRGSQPLYYYALVQVPVYEYLPALGTLLAFLMILFRGVKTMLMGAEPGKQEDVLPEAEILVQAEGEIFLPEREVNALVNRAVVQDDETGRDDEILPYEVERPALAEEPEKAPVIALLLFWSLTSLVAFSVAGEKMPWLTVHITLPMILAAGWACGRLIEALDWERFIERRGWLVLLLMPVFLLSFLAALGSLLGPMPPFQGKELDQLQATGTFMFSFLSALASGSGLLWSVRPWPLGQFARLMALFFFGLLGFLTARTAIQSSYYNYDNANELLVYAHAAGGVKVAMNQIEEISIRTTNGRGMLVAYDNETSYPYWWYLRNYPNTRYFGSDPTRSLREAPVILVGDANFGKVETVVGNAYYRFDYIRMWWPNQDYYDLTWERIWGALTDRQMRSAIFQIWLNRDYTLYGQATNRDMSLPNWSPAARMRLYVRKDVVAQLWNYGVAPAELATEPQDPFDQSKELKLSADRIIGQVGNQPGQFQRPRDLVVAADGSLYVADTENHRIQHLDRDGKVLQVWGSYGDAVSAGAPGGVFNQPWGIAVGLDGSVYVADTWNHRVQKFSAEGQFLTMWGYFGQAEKPEAFWGPRDVAVDAKGRVYVTDTGNKRVVVFDADGHFITEFGEAGLMSGMFDEPVGLAIDADGQVYVVDTWNQRIQVFSENETGRFVATKSWDVVAWFGQSLDNKPYMSVDSRGNLFVCEPEGYRVMWYSITGQPLHFWGDFGAGPDLFGMPASVAVDPLGGVWVSDAGNGRLMHFTLPLP